MEKSQVKQNILHYLSEKGISAYEFYRNAGITRGILQQNNGISENNIIRFLAYAPEVNIDWLLTGRGKMLKNDEYVREREVSKIVDNKSKDNSKPYFDVDFIGGFNEITNCQTSTPNNFITIQGFEKADFWCNVTGHSMEPKINHGDIIALRKCELEDVQYGEIYAVVLDTLRTIKILRRSSSPNTLNFVPINTNYDAQEFPKSRILHVYEVIGCISKFS